MEAGGATAFIYANFSVPVVKVSGGLVPAHGGNKSAELTPELPCHLRLQASSWEEGYKDISP